jgi:hypothetical protein
MPTLQAAIALWVIWARLDIKDMAKLFHKLAGKKSLDLLWHPSSEKTPHKPFCYTFYIHSLQWYGFRVC